MLLEDTRRVFVAPPGGWRPDPRASAALACCAAAIVCLAFLGLLYRPATGAKPVLLSLSVVRAPATRRTLPRVPSLPAAGAHISLPHLEPLPPIPGFIFLQEQVDAAVRDTVLSGQTGPFLAPPAQKYDELDRALQAPSKPGVMREGEGYRSPYGYTIVKSGGGCAAMEQVEVGPVAKANVGFIVPCPGGKGSDMTDALAAWAAKRAEVIPPP